MKVVKPDALLREAAEVLDPVRDDVVVIGASAVRVALDGRDAVITPTRDIDAGTQTAAVGRVVSQLEKAGLTRSPEPHEQGFTWVRGTLKVQLIRPMRGRVINAATTLLEEDEAIAAAIRELNRTGSYPTAEAARRAVERAGTRALRALK